jgi:hypothetical protein
MAFTNYFLLEGDAYCFSLPVTCNRNFLILYSGTETHCLKYEINYQEQLFFPVFIELCT